MEGPLRRAPDAANAALKRGSDAAGLFNERRALSIRLKLHASHGRVDICVRALGAPFDPTTAVQAMDRLHDFLRHLMTRKFPSGEHRDSAGALRLVTNPNRKMIMCGCRALPWSRRC
jgi:Predicted membrane protein (DUF2254)